MNITINAHSSIKFTTDKIIYFDPYTIENETHDADIIFVSHSHYDHFSPDDIAKIAKEDTILVAPMSILEDVENSNLNLPTIYVEPYGYYDIGGYYVETIPAYNKEKQFHPKDNAWVGYLVTIEDKVYYIGGDTDFTPDNAKITCDVALIPVGGTYTMDIYSAKEFVEAVKPGLVIPTHYGSVVGEMEIGDKFKELLTGYNVELKIK